MIMKIDVIIISVLKKPSTKLKYFNGKYLQNTCDTVILLLFLG